MATIKISVTGEICTVAQKVTFTAGSYGVYVAEVTTDASWDDLALVLCIISAPPGYPRMPNSGRCIKRSIPIKDGTAELDETIQPCMVSDNAILIGLLGCDADGKITRYSTVSAAGKVCGSGCIDDTILGDESRWAELISYINATIKSLIGKPTDEQVRSAVDAYVSEHGLATGATAEQAAQIEQNTKDISSLSEEIANLQSGGNDAGTGMTTEVKTLMLSLFKAAVYNNPEMQVTVDALEQKWTSSGSSDGEETVYYIITNNLTNVSNSNSAGAVAENTSYSATLTADSGYDLESVTVAMGGTDITSTAYTDGVIHISAVTGNVVIAATASATIEARTVYFASDDSIVKNAGNMNKAGEIKATTNVRCKVAELPYIEGMLIHTYCNPAGVSSDYPPFIFFDGINYTVPEFTTPTDYNHEIILSGQTGIEKVYVNMYGTVQGEFADDRFYYVTQ